MLPPRQALCPTQMAKDGQRARAAGEEQKATLPVPGSLTRAPQGPCAEPWEVSRPGAAPLAVREGARRQQSPHFQPLSLTGGRAATASLTSDRTTCRWMFLGARWYSTFRLRPGRRGVGMWRGARPGPTATPVTTTPSTGLCHPPGRVLPPSPPPAPRPTCSHTLPLQGPQRPLPAEPHARCPPASSWWQAPSRGSVTFQGTGSPAG